MSLMNVMHQNLQDVQAIEEIETIFKFLYLAVFYQNLEYSSNANDFTIATYSYEFPTCNYEFNSIFSKSPFSLIFNDSWASLYFHVGFHS